MTITFSLVTNALNRRSKVIMSSSPTSVLRQGLPRKQQHRRHCSTLASCARTPGALMDGLRRVYSGSKLRELVQLSSQVNIIQQQQEGGRSHLVLTSVEAHSSCGAMYAPWRHLHHVSQCMLPAVMRASCAVIVTGGDRGLMGGP